MSKLEALKNVLTDPAFLATALGVGATAGYAGVRAIREPIEKARTYKEMLELHPQLKRQDPKNVQRVFNSLHRVNPKVVGDPLLAGGYVGKAIENDSLYSGDSGYQGTVGVAENLMGNRRSYGLDRSTQFNPGPIGELAGRAIGGAIHQDTIARDRDAMNTVAGMYAANAQRPQDRRYKILDHMGPSDVRKALETQDDPFLKQVYGDMIPTLTSEAKKKFSAKEDLSEDDLQKYSSLGRLFAKHNRPSQHLRGREVSDAAMDRLKSMRGSADARREAKNKATEAWRRQKGKRSLGDPITAADFSLKEKLSHMRKEALSPAMMGRWAAGRAAQGVGGASAMGKE